MSSFLLQLEWRQKMMLVAKTKAIFNHAKYGPTFGKDLVISDECDQSQFSYSEYPKNYKYAYGKQFISASFCGAPKGEKFRVVEYEVYQVINWSKRLSLHSSYSNPSHLLLINPNPQLFVDSPITIGIGSSTSTKLKRHWNFQHFTKYLILPINKRWVWCCMQLAICRNKWSLAIIRLSNP